MSDSDLNKKKSVERARYEFKRKLEDLRGIRGSATQLISLYIPPGRQIHDVTAQLRSELSQAQNIKSKSTMKNVTGALESIMQRLKQFKDPGETGIVIFCGAKNVGGNQQKMVQEVVIPPEPVPSMIYNCDSTFLLEPLEGMLKTKNNYGLIVVDRQECTMGFLRGSAITPVTNMTSQVPNKHTKGGQSARRFERITENIADQWFQKCGEVANDIFLPAWEKGELKGILIGGPGPTKEYWHEKGYLHHELQKKVVGNLIDTGYTDEYGLKDLVDNAQDLLRDLGVGEQKELVQKFLKEIGKPDGGQASYGEDQVRHTLIIGAVETLLLSEKLRKYRIKVKCGNCDWGKDDTTPDPEDYEQHFGPCPECKQTTVYVDEKEDVVEELSELADNISADVRIISTGSDEGELLFKAFGGVGAILRFKVE